MLDGKKSLFDMLLPFSEVQVRNIMSTTEYSKEEVKNEKKSLGQSETEGYIRIRYCFVGKKSFHLWKNNQD